MAGIYVHIPWCRKVCVYCDFHFSVSLRNKFELLDCIVRELKMQKHFLGKEIVDTIYFGGGTPSILNYDELNKVIGIIYSLYNVSNNAEITLEANPDDLPITYLRDIKTLGINRLSIGIQSFFNDDLEWMNRRHDGNQAVNCIKDSKKAGFKNVNIDLIYGLPGLTETKWQENLQIAFKNDIQHLSAYHLTLESKTVYAHKIKKGIMDEPDENTGIKHFQILMDRADREGFLHYEISNFCLPGFISQHNTSYWFHKPYLGIGPSANSFNGNSRQWNVSNNTLYIKSIKEHTIPCNFENLGLKEKYNEYILTSLRTMWGADLRLIENKFGRNFSNLFIKEATTFINSGKLKRDGKHFKLTANGKLFADGIISQLFIAD